ncbi:Os03g0573350 [Oryza sativa Japonica Group]|uniref:Os03g0573350 protein n=2 Tax=Oryza sativa subsp. japonica TaxID=39947 RepID=B9F9E1_ORYSJ|nr:hypothetical protein OsJ_11508 [Oryza sativa Japonica Group]BAS85006.1 Os03g0573350 [Oryza sativa Japonica Group]
MERPRAAGEDRVPGKPVRGRMEAIVPSPRAAGVNGSAAGRGAAGGQVEIACVQADLPLLKCLARSRLDRQGSRRHGGIRRVYTLEREEPGDADGSEA